MMTTIEKIQSFVQLQPGWSFGEGIGFLQNVLNKAMQLAKTAHTLGFHETDAFPGLSGEIMVTVYQGCEYWEFTLQPTETITFVYEKNDKTVVYQEGLPSPCQHIERFYPPPTSSQPAIFWEFDEAILPSGYWIEQQTSPTGDSCHHNIFGLTDKVARDLLIQRRLDEFQVCDQELPRPVTLADLTPQP